MDTSEALDLSKENIQPLKQGRNAVKLSAALQAQTNSEVQQQLVKEREKFELMIRMYEGDDPLQPRYEYVSWIEQCYPKHGPDSNLVPLLEDTLTTFKDDYRYKQDPRFVELLVKYFDTQPNPLELYQLVYNQGLGTMCALFYRAWAEEFDKNNDMMRADQIFQLGIKSRAQPLDQLMEVHKLFQISVGRRTLGYMDNYTEEVDAYSREALSRQNKNKIPSIRDTSRAPGTWRSEPTNVLGQNQVAKSNIKVYQDNGNSDIFPGYMIAGASGVFPTHSVVQKENSLKAGPWTGPGHKVKHVIKPPTTPTFQVHEDEGAVGAYQPHTVVPRALKTKKQEVFNCPLAWFEPVDPTKQAMYCKNKVYVGGREFQFEELRAAEYRKRWQQHKVKCEESVLVTSASGECHLDQSVKNENKQTSNEEQHVQEETDKQDVDNAPVTALAGDNREAMCIEDAHINNIDISPRDVPGVSATAVPPVDEAACTEPLSVSDESESVHSIYSDKRMSIQNVVHKPLIDANASLTVNTKEAMNLVQEMWGTPSPKQAKQRKTFGSFKKSTTKSDDNVFKVPTLPRPKIAPFSLYTDEEPDPSEPETLASAIKPTFSVFTDDDKDGAKTVETKNEDRRKSSFQVYTDDFEKEKLGCRSYGLPGEKTRKELDDIESCEPNVPVFQSKPLLGLIAEVIKPSDRNDFLQNFLKTDPNNFVLGNSNQHKSQDSITTAVKESAVSKCLAFEDKSKFVKKLPSEGPKSNQNSLTTPFVKLGQSSEEHSSHSSVQHTPLQSNVQNAPFDNKQRPQMKFQYNIEDTDDDFTSNTGAFAFALPSSTPMNGHFQNASAQQTNISFTSEELLKKSLPVYQHQPELSLILEASKEKGSSSSSNGAACQDSDSNEGKQKTISQDIDEMEKSIGVLNLTGEINPFSSDLISQLLSLVGYPRPSHLTGVHHIDKDIHSLSVNSTVKMGSMTYCIKGEIGKGAYARVLKATRDDKACALKFQKPGCIWELYIIQELQLRLKRNNSNMIAGFMDCSNAFIYRNATVFESEWAEYGNLLNVVNNVKSQTSKNIPMIVVMIISKQLVSVVDHLHKCKIIHGDIKPDNFLLTALPSLDFPQKLCVKLIDFGRSIDMSVLPAGTKFSTVVSTDGFTCTEMLDKLPWTYQIDTFGLAGTMYLLIISDYMKVTKKHNKWQLQYSLPRYSEKSFWEPIFQTLLNVESCEKQADLANIEQCILQYIKNSVESLAPRVLSEVMHSFQNALNHRY